jgi:hypothetical protein
MNLQKTQPILPCCDTINWWQNSAFCKVAKKLHTDTLLMTSYQKQLRSSPIVYCCCGGSELKLVFSNSSTQ